MFITLPLRYMILMHSNWGTNGLFKRVNVPAWGIICHVLRSQIFDYWWDVFGNMMEHYADGDLVNQDIPIG